MNDELYDYLQSKFDAIVDGYRDELISVVENPQYWGEGFGRTIRSDGSVVVGGYRNIVDTGELRDSMDDYRSDDFEHTFEWSADHAVIVHEGTRKNSPRPWTRTAAENLDISDLVS